MLAVVKDAWTRPQADRLRRRQLLRRVARRGRASAAWRTCARRPDALPWLVEPATVEVFEQVRRALRARAATSRYEVFARAVRRRRSTSRARRPRRSPARCCCPAGDPWLGDARARRRRRRRRPAEGRDRRARRRVRGGDLRARGRQPRPPGGRATSSTPRKYVQSTVHRRRWPASARSPTGSRGSSRTTSGRCRSTRRSSSSSNRVPSWGLPGWPAPASFVASGPFSLLVGVAERQRPLGSGGWDSGGRHGMDRISCAACHGRPTRRTLCGSGPQNVRRIDRGVGAAHVIRVPAPRTSTPLGREAPGLGRAALARITSDGERSAPPNRRWTAYIDANVGRPARAADDPTLSRDSARATRRRLRARRMDGGITATCAVFPPRVTNDPPPYPAAVRRARHRRPPPPRGEFGLKSPEPRAEVVTGPARCKPSSHLLPSLRNGLPPIPGERALPSSRPAYAPIGRSSSA